MTLNYPGDDVARAAFDVMMLRKWGVMHQPAGDKWILANVRPFGFRSYSDGSDWKTIEPLLNMEWDDPFSAFVEGNAWYKEHIEGAKT